ncbi:MAG: hypothetical protein K2K04_07095 [Clostridia bacterium]|nr:hypothetical protein [Clostridia bacterium]
MAKRFKIKRKAPKTWLRKTLLCKVLPAYFAFLFITFTVTIGLLLGKVSENVLMIAAFLYFGLLLVVSYSIILVVIPLCRAKQAMLDLENHDFSHYTPKDTETFSHVSQTEKYYFTPSPFDDDEGVIEFSSGKAADDYFSQFAPERLTCVEELRSSGEYIPFTVFDFNDEYFNGTVEKRNEGEYVTVTVTEKPEITFAPDGVHLGEKIFAYEECEAYVFAEFVQAYARTSVSVNIVLGDDCAASFAFGTRIMSIIDKHKITVKDRELADFILSDPERAFRLLGLKRKISKNKLRRQRCNNKSDMI